VQDTQGNTSDVRFFSLSLVVFIMTMESKKKTGIKWIVKQKIFEKEC
jgi:hypothetical protein